MKKITLAIVMIFGFATIANAAGKANRKLAAITDSSFYADNLGCFPANSFKPAGYGNGFWITTGQGSDSGGSGSRQIKIVPLNQDVAQALQASNSKTASNYLCLGGASLGGPYDGGTPNVIYPFSASWK